MLTGYAHVSTNARDLTAQRNALRALGHDEEDIHVDHGTRGPTERTARPDARR